MKKIYPISIISIVGGAFVALCLSQIAFGKAHVPEAKGQICASGIVLTVSDSAVRGFQERERARGNRRGGGMPARACILPACDFANVFNSAGGCEGLADADNDGLCDLEFERDSAEGITAGCPVGTY